MGRLLIEEELLAMGYDKDFAGKLDIAKAQDAKTIRAVKSDLLAILKEAGDLRALERQLSNYVSEMS